MIRAIMVVCISLYIVAHSKQVMLNVLLTFEAESGEGQLTSLVELRHSFLTTFRMCPLSQQIDLSISTELQKKRNKFSHDIQAEAICELLQ